MTRAAIIVLLLARTAVAGPSQYTLEPARLTDGAHVVLPPMSIPSSTTPEADRRPIYIGAGLVAMAAAFWWNRRRREQFERDDAADDDSDDLHAAARGDAPKDET